MNKNDVLAEHLRARGSLWESKLRGLRTTSILALIVAFILMLGGISFGAPPPAATSAFFESVHVVKLPKQKLGYRGIGGDIEVLKDGRLVLAYTLDPGDFTEEKPSGALGIMKRYSMDEGRSWGPEVTLIARPEGKDEYGSPSFLRLANGQILLAYIYYSNSKPLFGQTYYKRSADEGNTWGDQLIVTPYPGYNLMQNDKLIQLSSGRVIAPVEHDSGGADESSFRGVSCVFYSDDNGYSWWKSKNIVDVLPVEAQEPVVVELKDGRIMMLCRTYSGYVVRAYSSDQGVTWSQGEHLRQLKLPANSSAINVKRIPTTGDLLLLRCSGGSDGRRTPMVSAISKDEGKTWIQERVIGGDPEEDYGYPSLMFLKDVAVISYHQRDGLHVARIQTDWFYGK